MADESDVCATWLRVCAPRSDDPREPPLREGPAAWPICGLVSSPP